MNWMVYSIVVRESFEAFLIIALLMSVLKKTSFSNAKYAVWFGVSGGLFLSFLFSYVIQHLSDFLTEQSLNLLEVVFPLVTACLLLHVIWWMHKHSSAYTRDLKNKLVGYDKTSNFWMIFTISCLAITREGFETVLFLSGELMQNEISALFIRSLLFGLLTTSVIYLLIQRISQIIKYKIFFNVTSVVLFLIVCKILFDTYNQIITRGWI